MSLSSLPLWYTTERRKKRRFSSPRVLPLSFVFLRAHTHTQTTTKTKTKTKTTTLIKTAAAARFFFALCVFGEEEIPHTTEYNGGKWSFPFFSCNKTRECLSLLFFPSQTLNLKNTSFKTLINLFEKHLSFFSGKRNAPLCITPLFYYSTLLIGVGWCWCCWCCCCWCCWC